MHGQKVIGSIILKLVSDPDANPNPDPNHNHNPVHLRDDDDENITLLVRT